MPSSDTSRTRRRLPLPPRVALGFGAALVSLVVAAVASYAALQARTSASVLVRHTAEAKLAIEEVQSALMVSDTALEAYLSGGDRTRAELHLEAVAHLDPAIHALELLARAHPEHAPKVSALAADVAVFGAEQARLEALVRAGDRTAARAGRSSGRGREALRRAIDALEELEDAEARLHAGREAAWNRSVAVSNAVFAAAVAVLLALILVAARLVHDEIRRREREAAARERALVVQRRIVGVVSHDLRNPLTGILVGARALGRGGLPERFTGIVARIGSAAIRMERLIRDLLDWTRLQDGVAMPVSAERADLAEVCRRAIDELGHGQDGRIEVLEEGETWGAFDPERIAQVVANLVSNALRHGEAGTPIRVRAAGAPGELLLEVENSGPEIPASERAEIFEPFRRGTRSAGTGVGLGLFIVRAVVEAHGGTVTLDSGRGTTRFVVRVPRSLAAPAASARPG